jgi:phospholipase/carboxylesterase
VIWLHGLGADGHDFAGVVPALGLPAQPPVRVVFPHAPMMPVTLNAGMVMRAWFDIAQIGDRFRVDEGGVRASAARVQALLEREQRRGVAPEHVVLAGFSQGGTIALHQGLRGPARLAGILALSTDLALAESLPAEARDAARRAPIFLAHGRHDPLVPVARGIATRDLLERLGYAVEWHEYPIQHEVSMEEVRDIGSWLRRVLA